jgi:hypothetical protein
LFRGPSHTTWDAGPAAAASGRLEVEGAADRGVVSGVLPLNVLRFRYGSSNPDASSIPQTDIDH